MTRVLLADDHKVVRDGLRRLLADESDMEVVGEASDGRTAHALAEELRPDVVVMDVTMPNLNGIEATRSMRRLVPPPHVVILSMHADPHYVTESLKAGASGYVLKDAAFEELVRAIRSVNSSGIYLSPSIARILTDNLHNPAHVAQPSRLKSLTPREREVLQLLAGGKSTKQIGMALGISGKTVESHRRRIMERLDLDNLAALAKFAIRTGLTTTDG